MSELLIIFALMAVGKIHGREADASQVVNQRHLPTFEHRPVLHRNLGRHNTPATTPKLYTNAYRPADLDQDNGSANLHLTPPTVRGTEPKRKLFISSNISAEMNRPLGVESTARRQNGTDDKDKNCERRNDNVKPVPPAVNAGREDATTSMPSNITDVPTMVTLDQRSSFNGDTCPPGYVKVKGECVLEDK